MRRGDTFTDIKRGRLTPHELQEIEQLGHLSAPQIALRLNRHPATVNYQLHRLGLRDRIQVRNFSYTRNGTPVRSWSPSEDEFIQRLRAERGLSMPKIAAAVTERFGYRRKPHSVLVRLMMLANVENGDADPIV